MCSIVRNNGLRSWFLKISCLLLHSARCQCFLRVLSELLHGVSHAYQAEILMVLSIPPVARTNGRPLSGSKKSARWSAIDSSTISFQCLLTPCDNNRSLVGKCKRMASSSSGISKTLAIPMISLRKRKIHAICNDVAVLNKESHHGEVLR